MHIFQILMSLLMGGLLSLSAAAQPVVEWLGQGDQDVVGEASYPNGINDWVISITDDQLARLRPVSWNVAGGFIPGGGGGYWHDPEDGTHWPLVAVQEDRQVLLLMDPIWCRPGEVFRINAVLEDERQLTWFAVAGDAGWRGEGRFYGQSERDLVGEHYEPNGILDWQISVAAPELSRAKVAEVEVRLVNVRNCIEHWSSTGSQVQPLVFFKTATGLELYIEPALAVAGAPFWVRATLEDGRCLYWRVVGDGSTWSTHGDWWGQDADHVGPELAEPNGVLDWRTQVSDERGHALNAKRWVVRSPEGQLWQWPESAGRSPLHVRLSGARADLFMEPHTDRAGGLFLITAVDARGKTLNWGITASRSVFSSDAQWLGQSGEELAPPPAPEDKQTPVLDGVRDWVIRVADPKLAAQEPLAWSVRGAKQEWGHGLEAAQTTEEEPSETSAEQPWELVPVMRPGGVALLHLKPAVNSIITDPFDISARFADGTLINWSVSGMGFPQAPRAIWSPAERKDLVSASSVGPNEVPDWRLDVEAPGLVGNRPVRWRVTGAGRIWTWPQQPETAPLAIEPGRKAGHWSLYLEPTSEAAAGAVFTLQAVLNDGTIQQWHAIVNVAEDPH